MRFIGVSSYNLVLVVLGVVFGGMEKILKIWDIVGVWLILLVVGGEFFCFCFELLFLFMIGEDYGDCFYFCIIVSCREFME